MLDQWLCSGPIKEPNDFRKMFYKHKVVYVLKKMIRCRLFRAQVTMFVKRHYRYAVYRKPEDVQWITNIIMTHANPYDFSMVLEQIHRRKLYEKILMFIRCCKRSIDKPSFDYNEYHLANIIINSLMPNSSHNRAKIKL